MGETHGFAYHATANASKALSVGVYFPSFSATNVRDMNGRVRNASPRLLATFRARHFRAIA